MQSQKRIIGILTAVCGVTWVAAAIHPLDRQAWFLENILLVLFATALAATYRKLQFSTASLICIAAFVLLHIIGSHYTYARMPIGDWTRDWFGFSRNHYDRVAHGSFGLLMAFPIRELLLRFVHVRPRWSLWLAPTIILAASGVFEILESITAEIVAPGAGPDWLSAQGDEWDAQNDMIAAFLGAILMMVAVAISRPRPMTNEE